MVEPLPRKRSPSLSGPHPDWSATSTPIQPPPSRPPASSRLNSAAVLLEKLPPPPELRPPFLLRHALNPLLHRPKQYFNDHIYSIRLFHILYFTLLVSLSSIIFLAAPLRDGSRLGFVDAVFLAMTSATGAGLGNVPVSTLSGVQQAVVLVAIAMGGQVVVACVVVWVGRWRVAGRVRRGEGLLVGKGVVREVKVEKKVEDREKKGDEEAPEVTVASASSSTTVVESNPGSEEDLTALYPRLRLLTLLSWLLPVYALTFHIPLTLAIYGYLRTPTGLAILATNPGNAIPNPFWAATFNAISSFANSGMSLLDDNMAPFATCGAVVVLSQSALILAGNTAFPLILSGIVAVLPNDLTGVSEAKDMEVTAKWFPYLVPRREKIWLAIMLFLTNTINTVAFLASPLDTHLPGGRKLLAGIFQALAIRHGGFGITNISTLNPNILILYILSMYLSPFPVHLPPTATPSSVGHRIRSAWGFTKAQLRALVRAGDLKLLTLALFLILATERRSEADFVRVLFEIVSAYGEVGVSFGGGVGVAEVATWGEGGKIVLGAVMGWGRGREVRRGLGREWVVG